MTEERPGERDSENRRETHRMRIPGFITDTDIGLGDVIKRATSTVGIRSCGGCAERARWLNHWMVFSPRR